MDESRDEASGRAEDRLSPGHDFDAAYVGTPPWDIGAPQPAIGELAEQGTFGQRVLDAGCGTGEHALLAASLGCEATGIDTSPRAIALAKSKAVARLLQVRFLIRDALGLGSLHERFDTVIDSGLFHVFDDPSRASYVEALGQVTEVGGRVILVCFSDRVPGDRGPRRVTEAELYSSFSDGWQFESIELVQMKVILAPDGVQAWRAVMTRVAITDPI